MTEPLVLFVPFLLVVGAVLAVAVVGRGRRRGWLAAALRRRLLVHTVGGETFDGQLARVDRDGLVLSPTTLEGEYKLGGEVWVPRERISWAQQPVEGEAADR